MLDMRISSDHLNTVIGLELLKKLIAETKNELLTLNFLIDRTIF